MKINLEAIKNEYEQTKVPEKPKGAIATGIKETFNKNIFSKATDYIKKETEGQTAAQTVFSVGKSLLKSTLGGLASYGNTVLEMVYGKEKVQEEMELKKDASKFVTSNTDQSLQQISREISESLKQNPNATPFEKKYIGPAVALLIPAIDILTSGRGKTVSREVYKNVIKKGLLAEEAQNATRNILIKRGIEKELAEEMIPVILKSTTEAEVDDSMKFVAVNRMKKIAESETEEALNTVIKPVEIVDEVVPAETNILKETTTEIPEPSIKQSSLSKNIVEDARREGITLPDETIQTYEERNILTQDLPKALDFVDNNPALAKKIIANEADVPTELGLYKESVYTALKQKAIREKDMDTLMLLKDSDINLEATTLGQRIKALDDGLREADPVRIAKEVESANIENAKKYNPNIEEELTKTKESFKRKSKEVKEVIKKNIQKKETLESFINSIKC